MFKKIMIGCGGLIGLVIVLGICGAIINSSKSTSTPTATPKTSAATATPAGKLPLMDIAGSGTKSTDKFTARSDWDLAWTYDCSNFYGGQGNFIVQPYTGDNSPSFENNGVNQIGKSGGSTEHYHAGGTFYLKVISTCDWTVKVLG